MRRIWKAAFLGLVLAFAAGCPSPGNRASTDSPYAQVPQIEVPAEIPSVE